MRLTRPFTTALLPALALGLGTPHAAAFEFQGLKTVSARTADGGQVELGSVRFTPGADGRVAFALSLKHEAFTDHFLSMREFKCLAAALEVSCHVPYPYAQPGTLRPDDLSWLEHSLLFFFKTPADFGAKLWNGLYFEFKDEGTALVGRPKAIDLNQIAAPPADPARPPYPRAQRHEMPAGSRWIRSLVIE